jgi:hypothetical protein
MKLTLQSDQIEMYKKIAEGRNRQPDLVRGFPIEEI